MIPLQRRGVWVDEQIAKHLEPAMAITDGRITIGQVFYLWSRDMVQVWFAIEDKECITVTVTEIVEFVSGRKCLKLVLVGGYGSLDRAIGPVLKRLEEFAMMELCGSVLVEGRKGWERALPDGYKFSHVTCEKELF